MPNLRILTHPFAFSGASCFNCKPRIHRFASHYTFLDCCVFLARLDLVHQTLECKKKEEERKKKILSLVGVGPISFDWAFQHRHLSGTGTCDGKLTVSV